MTDLDSARLQRFRERLQAAKEAALAALDAGTFGTCRHCDGPISEQRLEAVPEAPFCLDCQELFERGG